MAVQSDSALGAPMWSRAYERRCFGFTGDPAGCRASGHAASARVTRRRRA